MITIVVADDQMLTREGLRTILELEDDFEVIGVAKNGEEACELAESLLPDLMLLDIQMPVMDGISALKRIKRSCPNIFVLILTTFIDADYIVEGMAHGASGYMLKDMDADKMIASIRDTVSGQFILPGAVAAKLAARMNRFTEDYEHRQCPRLDLIKLTEREEELAQLIIRGLNNREIADELHIAEGTARNYISNLYGKLEVVDRAQAMVRLQTLI
ncbi:response regulator [Paenibacillus macquariensis]|uniref:Two component transcriptional regulator, LuxR family n=1 Tax=Paenibacillus macquariensis TaxID=948756 RepID=A0ABY1K5S9_9BACL|nr:response regulator transcription factor [Paenibacillus macquariensis]MEC0090494.1 response regulator transcription factor [Paenibacillus macquariensis]OAB38496.1 DNA-binding response regulator [Paenibacillus macquariensis subsp. macquariensis]SIR30141.1 two component transcriptional regulator, LuxR family [Paenibacillus macquariensis]